MKEAFEKILTSAVSCLHLNGPDNRWCVGGHLKRWHDSGPVTNTPPLARGPLAQSCWRMMEAG